MHKRNPGMAENGAAERLDTEALTEDKLKQREISA
jgi:hypothetical protein